MKLFRIDFKDKRRVQRSMCAESKQEVIDYIKNKYNAEFTITEASLSLMRLKG